MKYIREFENHSQYQTYTADTSNFILPNVSLCVQENEVHYKPIDPYNGHEYVEIGGLKWATMNVGATVVSDYGLHFQWGDTQGYTASEVGSGEGQKYFGWADYKYNSGGTNPSASDMTKYNSTDTLTTLSAADDAVAVAWGGNWRMPTKAEFNELLNNTNKQWTTVNGISGYTFTDKTDASKYVFFPAAGNYYDGSMNNVGKFGNYWLSSLSASDAMRSSALDIHNGYCFINSYTRQFGFSVRGVVG